MQPMQANQMILKSRLICFVFLWTYMLYVGIQYTIYAVTNELLMGMGRAGSVCRRPTNGQRWVGHIYQRAVPGRKI